MTTYFSLEFESKSIDLDINTFQMSSSENNKNNFLAKKRIHIKENTHNKKEYEEPKNGNIFENMNEKNNYINNFLMLEEFSVFQAKAKKILELMNFIF